MNESSENINVVDSSKMKHPKVKIPLIEEYVKFLTNNDDQNIRFKKFEAIKFYSVISEYSRKKREFFDITKLRDDQINYYLNYLQERVDKGEIIDITRKHALAKLNYFLDFLIKKNIVKVAYSPKIRQKYSILDKNLQTINAYKKFLANENVKNAYPYILETKKFYSFLQNKNLDSYHLGDQQFELYFQSLNKRVQKEEMTLSTCKDAIQKLNHFIDYLIKQEVRITFKPYIRRNEHYPTIFADFELFLKRKNFSCINKTICRARLFHKFLLSQISSHIFDYNMLTEDFIKKYEEFLAKRMTNEEMTRSSVYMSLLSLKHFIEFLFNINIVDFKYAVPEKFRENSKRRNKYVPTTHSIDLIAAIKANSNLRQRDIAITLLLIDTGCRPVEISNINISDINLIESTIILWSKKSGQRHLKISNIVNKAIKSYLNVRDTYNPNDYSLFITNSGNKLNPVSIGNIIYRFNIKAFNENKFSASAYRHTFITNALDNGYSLEQTAEITGHTNISSTLYYSNRNPKRLNKNSLPHNPVSKFSKEVY